jgi:acetyl-CoA synthetase
MADGCQWRPSSPSGESGELVLPLPDPVVFLWYWNDPEATAAVFTDDGWHRTSDFAVRDEDGYLYFRGR